MDLSPGSQARDSRSLSVEAAQYGQQEIDAEADVRRIEAQMEAQMKAARAKVEAARLQKLQTEAAREDAYQEERRERQAEVKASVTDHHLEGMNKAVEIYSDFGIMLRGLAAGDFENDEAAIWLRNIFLKELVGSDDHEFLSVLAGRLLEQRELATGKGGAAARQISPQQAPTSPTPAKSPLPLPTSLQQPSYESRGSPDIVGTDENATNNKLGVQDYPELNTNEMDLDIEEDVVSADQGISPADVFENAEESDMIEVDHSTEVKQEPALAIKAMAKSSQRKRQSTGTIDSMASDVSGISRPSTATTLEDDSAPQTPESVKTTIHKNHTAGTPESQKPTPASKTPSKKPAGKRKRQEPDANTVEEDAEITVTPAPKKARTKAKDENSIPPRVTNFIASVQGMSDVGRAQAVLCGMCQKLPGKPRLSSCNHMYCEVCWKDLVTAANTKKTSEVRCGRGGCQGHLGKAYIVPAEFDITNLGSELWTGGKNATESGGAAGLESDRGGDAIEVEDTGDSIAVE